ncbi:hypothetical protein LJC32_02770 [Oscillospiraceae bacterium OttesenSCG-928-F05]|nr:hypothetical protein [Oscillospiraceae bacterium OttesenSCG-928-F05]
MEAGQIVMFIIQTVTTIVIALIGWGVKNTLSGIKGTISQNAADIRRIDKDINDLKNDLPFVYTTREDFIRSLNNVDKQMHDINGKLDRILDYRAKEG